VKDGKVVEAMTYFRETFEVENDIIAADGLAEEFETFLLALAIC